MQDFDDRPLERAADPLTPPPPRRASLTPIVLVTLAGLLLGAAAAWWWTSGRTAATPEPAAAVPPPIDAPPVTATEEAPRELPPLDQMDTFLRALLGTLSANPELARWLATEDLVRQMARSIDRVSRGQTPTADAALFRPGTELTSVGPRGKLTIDPASYRRYDRVAAMVHSLDAARVAEVYRTIRPRLDEAYRGLGRADTSVDQAVDVALQRLIETPVPDDPIAIVPGKGTTYAYRDPQLEALAPVQKQLLRMGPENARRIQAKLREIDAALDATR